MANPQNLKPFPPGVSGNPAGQPSKKDLLKTALLEVIEEEHLEKEFARVGMAMALESGKRDRSAKSGKRDRSAIYSMGKQNTRLT